MAKRRNSCGFSAQFLTAYIAVNYHIVASSLCTRCRYFLLLHRFLRRMAKRGFFKRFAADFSSAHVTVHHQVIAARFCTRCRGYSLPHRFRQRMACLRSSIPHLMLAEFRVFKGRQINALPFALAGRRCNHVGSQLTVFNGSHFRLM